jgi:hypothetical protein
VTRKLVVVGMVVGLSAVPAWAQRANNLDLGLEVSGVYEEDAVDQPSSPGSGVSDGYSSSLVGSASFARVRRTFRLDTTMLTALRYYGGAERVTPTTHQAGVTAGFTFADAINVDITQSAAYSPSYLFQLFPSTVPIDPNIPVAAAPDYRISTSTSMSRSTGVSMSSGTPFGNVTASMNRRATDFWGESSALDMTTTSIRGGLSWRFGRRYGLSTEYEHRTGQFGSQGESIDSRVRVAGEYSRPLSATRRATIKASVAPSRLRAPQPATTVSPDGTPQSAPTEEKYSRMRMETFLEGNVDLTRRWIFTAQYRRGIDYVATFSEPVSNTGGSIGVNGTVLKRLQVRAVGGWANGVSGIRRNDEERTTGSDFKSYTGSVRLSMPVTASVAAYGEYLYYYYDFRGQAGVGLDAPSLLDRRSVRFGVSVSARPIGRR